MKPLVVSVLNTCQLTGIRPTKVYQLIRDGVLRSVKIGRARRIFVDSIEELIGGNISEEMDWDGRRARSSTELPDNRQNPEAALYSHGNAGNARLERDLGPTGQSDSPKKPISFSNAPAMVEKNNGK